MHGGRSSGRCSRSRASLRRCALLTHPLIALPIWAVDLYLWHIPFFYDGALHHNSVHALEHFLFFTCGCLMWEPVIETLPAPEWFGTGVKVGYIFAVRLLETIIGNVFMWSGSMFYSVYRHAPEWGITPGHDLSLGGVVMMAEGSIVTLVTLAWLFLRMASEGELRQNLLEQGLDPRQVKRAVRFRPRRRPRSVLSPGGLEAKLRAVGGDGRGVVPGEARPAELRLGAVRRRLEALERDVRDVRRTDRGALHPRPRRSPRSARSSDARSMP